MLTVVIPLAFLSMSEALSRQGYLLVPEKAETADPAHTPCLSLPLADRGCVCGVLCECERVCARARMLNGFCLCMYVYIMKCVCVCVCDRLA